MSRIRRSFEQGHNRKFLVVIDDSVECDRAIYYAARRAKRTGGSIVMLRVIGSDQVEAQWLQVEAMMRAEEQEDAEALLAGWQQKIEMNFGLNAEPVIREGQPIEQIQNLLNEDEDIAIVILAASSGADGPGPIIANLALLLSCSTPVPITLVPDSLTDEEINALA